MINEYEDYYLRRVAPVTLHEVVKPETALEAYLLERPEVILGMAWGTPRFGHPEGAVWRHVMEVLANIEKLRDLAEADRRDLRIVALVHDTFKYAENKVEPRDWTQHHGILARRFISQFIDTRRVVDLVEWHDEAYYCWRLDALHHRPNRSRQRLDRLIAHFGDEMDFYYRFFVCDTKTGDKNMAPLQWLDRELGNSVLTW